MIEINPCERKADYLNKLALVVSHYGNYKICDALHLCAENIRLGKPIDKKLIKKVRDVIINQPRSHEKLELCETLKIK